MAKEIKKKKKKIIVEKSKTKIHNHKRNLFIKKAKYVAYEIALKTAIYFATIKLIDIIEKHSTGNKRQSNNTGEDPFNIRSIKNIKDLKKKCRDLYIIHHPDKGGNRHIFEHVLELCRQQEELINNNGV